MSLPGAVLFDLLTALLDSWSVWNAAAGPERAGRAWRAEYLRLTYGCGAYHSYEDLVRQAAHAVGLRTYWHNRVGLGRPDGAPPADHESRNLDDLVPWLGGLR